jgi:mutator protein MutT
LAIRRLLASSEVERRDAVGAVVLRDDGRVLVIRRGRAPGRGTWTLPGGKVEPGESPTDAVVREVREETGLAVEVAELLTVVELDIEGFSYAIHEHLCRVTGAADPARVVPRPGDDAEEVRWALPGELEALGVSSATRGVVALGCRRRSAW